MNSSTDTASPESYFGTFQADACISGSTEIYLALGR